MDFYNIRKNMKKDGIEIFPDFIVGRSKDLMVRGGAFYAIWDEERGFWSTDSYDVQRLIDKELREYAEAKFDSTDNVKLKLLGDFSSNLWNSFKKYIKLMDDNAYELDSKLTFANTKVKKEDHVSKSLPYSLEEGNISAYDELMSTLYAPKERNKIEWAIGCVVAGEMQKVHKFLVLHGEGGTGKSTVLNIIQDLFQGYHTTFDSKALVSNNNQFASTPFKNNPLVAIEHEGDLSRVEDNSKLNSIVSHDIMIVNEKFKSEYQTRTNCIIFIGTNKDVKITDMQSGLLRRLIDVRPTGDKIPPARYFQLVEKVKFELGAIAKHCYNKYKKLGTNYYAKYVPTDMMAKTNDLFNFVESEFHFFKERDGVQLKQIYDMYKEYCEYAKVNYPLSLRAFREEMKNYFKKFHPTIRIDGKQFRSYYEGFLSKKFVSSYSPKEEVENEQGLVLDKTISIFDKEYAGQTAQYASKKETPTKKWAEVTTMLVDLDTTKLHYVKLPENHIIIDFDLKNDNGEKSLELNLEAASKWPETYAEFSKSEAGIHLHYIYDGDASKLERIYSKGIEIKVFNGDSSLRRKLTKCNHIPIAKIKDGLPIKKGDKVINLDVVRNEKALRALIAKNLRKEIHPGTKPSVDFIYKLLDDAYASGVQYDLTDMRPAVLSFACNSSNQSEYCVKLVTQMKFASELDTDNVITNKPVSQTKTIDEDLVFFDCEVFPNLFVVCWKKRGKDKPIIKMINPKAEDIAMLLDYNLVGFNCRGYDNHILYAAYLGYDNIQLYNVSQRIISNSSNGKFREAYSLSYTDVHDFSSKKQSLKKWEIELGIHHQELGFPWDDPVDEKDWPLVAEYCGNDVIATEAVFEARIADYEARKILCELSGLTMNDTTQKQTARIIFGNDRNPQSKFVYTDLSEMFPGYKYENGKSTYRGEEIGEGGHVYAEPGAYYNVSLLDVASMHPTSLIQMNMFGPYTEKFKDIVNARLALKHKEFDAVKKMFDGKLAPFVNEERSADLTQALKIIINIVYGLTAASFENEFRDPRNKDNIVAKRGALFMVDLKHAVQERGYKVAHIKTDSIKIPDANESIIQFVIDFGKQYGYDFEHEADYSRFCLVNDAVYIAKYKYNDKWTATGAQFQHPYVFKSMFSNESIDFKDLCETKAVTSAIYIDMNENLSEYEHNYIFVGKVGSFVPIKEGRGGGILYREKDGKYYAVTGTKGYRWLEAEIVKNLNKEDDIDYSYFGDLVDKAHQTLGKYCNLEDFMAYDPELDDAIPF